MPQPVNLGLNANVGGSFQLEIASFLVSIELTGEGALDISRTCVVPFDQIGVVGVHDAH